MAEVIAGNYRHNPMSHWAKWRDATDPRHDQGACNLIVLCKGDDYRPIEDPSYWSFYHSGLLPNGPICTKCERIRVQQSLDGPAFMGAGGYRRTYEEQKADQAARRTPEDRAARALLAVVADGTIPGTPLRKNGCVKCGAGSGTWTCGDCHTEPDEEDGDPPGHDADPHGGSGPGGVK